MPTSKLFKAVKDEIEHMKLKNLDKLNRVFIGRHTCEAPTDMLIRLEEFMDPTGEEYTSIWQYIHSSKGNYSFQRRMDYIQYKIVTEIRRRRIYKEKMKRRKK